MAHRGVQAYRRRLWEIEQRRLGREDSRAGRPASLADQYYQRGYREGKLPCQCDTVAAHEDGCQRAVAKRSDPPGLCAFCKRGHREVREVDEELVKAKLQARWDEYAQEFADAVASECEDTPRHLGKDLWLDLDDCYAADTGESNYPYGEMHAAHEIASDLGVELDQRIPLAAGEAVDDGASEGEDETPEGGES